ncbi:MAG: TIGR02466 family protein [Gammaproteobacteria bacterium]
MTVRPWFPTLLYDAALGGRDPRRFNRDLLAECLQIREVDAEGRRWSRSRYPGGYTSYASLNQLHRMSSTFMALERRLRRHVHAYARALDWDLTRCKLEMTDCWVNVMPRLCSHASHLHPTASISGTYYVRTPRGCSRLRFEDPRLSMQMAAPPRVAAPRPANETFVYYPVQAGRVILFESWLRHEVPAGTVDAERVSVSFNWNWF